MAIGQNLSRISVILLMGTVASPALAQAAASPAVAQQADNGTKADEQGGLQEIVVTAQRREENLQNVPIAITAITASVAAKQGITDPQSLAGMVPGLQFQRQGSQSIPFLRGVGTTINTVGDEPSIAYYVDDVYYSSGAASFSNFNNLDRIEVEKGPQGTLFGRNATGGVIQIFTRNPTQNPVADLKLGYANYDTKSASIYASGGITDNLAANISAYGSKQSHGWGHNFGTGDPSFTGYDYGGRAKLLWTPGPETTLLLTVDHDTTRTQQGIGFHPYAGTLAGLGGVPGFVATPPKGYYDLDLTTNPYVLTRQSGVSLKGTEDLGWAKLISITAYRTTSSHFALDLDVQAAPLVNNSNASFDRTWTQELQLQSDKRSWINWIAGFYYFTEATGSTKVELDGLLFPKPVVYDRVTQATSSFSGFGQATAKIVADTNLTVGLRYTVDQRQLEAISADGVPASNSPLKKDYSKLTYRFSLDHKFSSGVMAYGAYTRGFKSGVFNVLVPPGAEIEDPVKPEVLDSYTLGAKTEWLDHKLRLNVEAFLYKYKNIQIQATVGSLNVLSNAASATIRGIDFDAQLVPVRNLTLSGSLELLHGRYDSLPNGLLYTYDPVNGGNVTTGADLSGNRTVHTPSVSWSASANYKLPLDERGDLAFNVAWSHSSRYFGEPDNAEGQTVPGVDLQKVLNLVNASLNWTSRSGAWGIGVWGKNLAGEKYWSESSLLSFASQYSPAPPRTFGGTVTYHFGS